jgi:hypothetical protein
VKPLADDVPMAGERMPTAEQIDDLLRILATIRVRFGNTAVTYSIEWGGGALWAADKQAKRIAELERLCIEAADDLSVEGGRHLNDVIERLKKGKLS